MPQPTTAADEGPAPLTDTGDARLDAKLAALDDDLQPIDPANDPLKTEEPESEEADEPEPEEDTEEEPEEKPAGEAKETAKKDDGADGYLLEDEEPAKDGAVTEPVITKPQEQYILDGIKDQAITVRGTVGDSDEVKQFSILMPEQLPQGFKYIDSREQSIADKSYMLIEQEANRLKTEYDREQQQSTTSDFSKRELVSERQDANSLQKDGVIKPFTKNPDVPRGYDTSNYRNVIKLLAADKDEAAVLINDVLDFKDKQNDAYSRDYQRGGAYRHIGFDEAYQMYQRQNPTKGNPEQVKEDKERHALAKRTGRTTGSATTKQVRRSKLPQGASSMDIDNYIESLDL